MKVFIAGPRALTSLDDNVKERLNNIIKKNVNILVGDANGIDKSIQNFLHSNSYENVSVYASNGKARNNQGNWLVKNVAVNDGIKGFDFYVAKDIEMAEDADYGFMIWNGKSKGTLNNIINLTVQNKKVLLYYAPQRKFYTLSNIEMTEKLAVLCGNETKKIFYELFSSKTITEKSSEQLALSL